MGHSGRIGRSRQHNAVPGSHKRPPPPHRHRKSLTAAPIAGRAQLDPGAATPAHRHSAVSGHPLRQPFDTSHLVRLGYAATSHHQGASKATAEQAAWLAGARRVVICADLDDAGFLCALRRYELVGEVVGPRRVSVVCARGEGSNDVSDHLTAGFTVEQLERVPIPLLRRISKSVTPAKVRADGYSWTGPDQFVDLLGRNDRP